MADTTENEKRTSWGGWKRIAAITSVLLVFVALDQLCFENPVVLWPCRCLAYLGLVLGLASFAYWRYLPTRKYCSSESADGRKRSQSLNRGGQDGRAEAARSA